MPEEQQDDIDLTGTLGSIANSLTNYKNDETTGKAGWIAAGIAIVLALIAVAVLAYQAWVNGKERAKALHEAAVRAEEAHQAEVDAKLAEDQVKIDAALAEAQKARDEVLNLQKRAEDLEAERVRINSQIDKITSWEDVDAIVRK